MNDKIKGLIIGLIAGSLFAGVAPAFADYGIKIFGNFKEISLYVDGENKVTTEAMIYKGITYVPVRSVSDAIGKTIKPDFERNSIYIGSEPTQKGITINQAFDLVERKYQVPDGYTYSMNGIEDGKYVIHVFKIVVYPETGDGHTATFGWYYVDKMTKKVSSMF